MIDRYAVADAGVIDPVTPPSLRIDVVGTPSPQGSKRHFCNGRLTESSKRVAPWRYAVVQQSISCAHEQGWVTPAGPVGVRCAFVLRRPAPAGSRLVPHVEPVMDELIRSTWDALMTAGVIVDDSWIVEALAEKCYAAAGGDTGAVITVTDLL